jgi:allantoinase
MNMAIEAIPPFHYSSIVSRPPLAWPNGAQVAFAIVLSVEHYELAPPAGSFRPPTLPGGFGAGPYPDIRAFSHREYGNRVGYFRLASAIERLGLTASVAIDAGVAENCPALVDDVRSRGWEWIGHGLSVTQVISSTMTETQEVAYIDRSLAALEALFGERPAGWHGPEYGQSARTLRLLAERGLGYQLDWPNDEQPYWMTTPSGSIIALPMAIDFDDVFAHWHRKISMEQWCASLIDALETMTQREESARMIVLNLHPWLTGQPWRMSFVESLLAEIVGMRGIWFAGTGDIAAWYRQLNPFPPSPKGEELL